MGSHESEHRNSDIIQAAQSVFADYGYKKATMDDVACKMDITRSALYYYYKNKEDLFIAVLEHELALYDKELDGLIGQAGTPEEKLVAFGATYINLRRNFINMYKLTYDDMSVSYDIINRIRRKMLSLHAGSIVKILKNDQAVAYMPNIDSVSQLLSMSLRGVVFNSTDVNDDSLQHDLTYLCRIFYHGLIAMSHNKTVE